MNAVMHTYYKDNPCLQSWFSCKLLQTQCIIFLLNFNRRFNFLSSRLHVAERRCHVSVDLSHLNMSYGQITERREVSVLCCVGVNYSLSELHQVFFGTGSHSAVSAPATGLFLSHWCGQTAVHIPMVAKNMKTLLHALWIPS